MNLFTVRKHTLLLIASIVWLAAGINIARIASKPTPTTT